MIERDSGGIFLCHKVNPLVPDHNAVGLVLPLQFRARVADDVVELAGTQQGAEQQELDNFIHTC